MPLSYVSCAGFAALLLTSITALPACGLVSSSSNIGDVAIDLPDQQFTVDTASWQIGNDAATAYLAKSCAAEPSACASAADATCAAGCTGNCDTTTHTCDLSLDVSLYQVIDVAKEQPAVAKVGEASSCRSRSIRSPTRSRATRSTSIRRRSPCTSRRRPSPRRARWRARMARSRRSPRARRPRAPSSSSRRPAARILSAAMSAYDTPFNIIVGTTLLLRAGDSVPTGELDARLHITAHASL